MQRHDFKTRKKKIGCFTNKMWKRHWDHAIVLRLIRVTFLWVDYLCSVGAQAGSSPGLLWASSAIQQFISSLTVWQLAKKECWEELGLLAFNKLVKTLWSCVQKGKPRSQCTFQVSAGIRCVNSSWARRFTKPYQAQRVKISISWWAELHKDLLQGKGDVVYTLTI